MKKANQIVQDLSELNFAGNITPASWWRHILKVNNKVNQPWDRAINILAEICYQYRGVLLPDSAGSSCLYQKFNGDAYSMSYRQLKNRFGYSKDVARPAIDYLHDSKLIIKHIEDCVTLPNGRKLYNVMYLIPIPANIAKITYNTWENDSTEEDKDNDYLNTGGSSLLPSTPSGLLPSTPSGLLPTTNTEITITEKEIDRKGEILNDHLKTCFQSSPENEEGATNDENLYIEGNEMSPSERLLAYYSEKGLMQIPKRKRDDNARAMFHALARKGPKYKGSKGVTGAKTLLRLYGEQWDLAGEKDGMTNLRSLSQMLGGYVGAVMASEERKGEIKVKPHWKAEMLPADAGQAQTELLDHFKANPKELDNLIRGFEWVNWESMVEDFVLHYWVTADKPILNLEKAKAKLRATWIKRARREDQEEEEPRKKLRNQGGGSVYDRYKT